MKRIVLLALTLLFTISVLLLRPVQMQRRTEPLPEQPLANPADYPEAGPSCKRKVELSPWIGTPGVEWPNTFQCVLKIDTCDGVKTSVSGVRPSGTGMCADFWRVHDQLVNRKICCDNASEETRDKPPESDCQTPTPSKDPPWFSKDIPCQDPQRGSYSWGQNRRDPTKVSVSVVACGQVIRFVGSPLTPTSTGVRSFDVCCDSWRNAVRTGSPCNPQRDIDCDGQLNERDLSPIAARSTASEVDYVSGPIATLPFWRHLQDSMPRQSECKICKWAVVHVKYTCQEKVTRIGRRGERIDAEYEYEATWKCPASGQTQVNSESATLEGLRCPRPPNRSWP